MELKVVAVKECAEGNESVGTMWVQTAIFDASQPISDVLKWSENASNTYRKGTVRGRLMLTLADDAREETPK